MICRRCGKELNGVLRCSFCGYDNTEGNVREMTNIEKNFYNGITIDADGNSNQNSNQTNNQNFNRRNNYYSRRTIYTSSSNGILSRLFDKLINGLINNSTIAKVAAGLIVFAVVALTFFIALPIIFVILAVGLALFTINRLGR